MSISQGQFYQRCACIGHCTNFGIVPTICNCQKDKLRIKRSLWIVPYYNWEGLPTTTARSFWARPWCVSACADSYRRALDPLHKSCSRPERQQKLRIETTIVTTANAVVSIRFWPIFFSLKCPFSRERGLGPIPEMREKKCMLRKNYTLLKHICLPNSVQKFWISLI